MLGLACRGMATTWAWLQPAGAPVGEEEVVIACMPVPRIWEQCLQTEDWWDKSSSAIPVVDSLHTEAWGSTSSEIVVAERWWPMWSLWEKFWNDSNGNCKLQLLQDAGDRAGPSVILVVAETLCSTVLSLVVPWGSCRTSTMYFPRHYFLPPSLPT